MKYKLAEIGRIVTGKTPSTKNKTSFSEEPDKYLFVTPRDMNSSEKTIKGTERYLTDEVTNTFKNLVINDKSICVSCIGTIGKVFMPSGLAITNQQINSITEIKNFVLPDYLYYYLTIHQKDIENLAGGTTMPIVNKTSFEQLEVEIPDLETQKKIVRILFALDQKIELNNQQNKTIEKQALALVQKYINNEKGTVKLKEIMSFDNGFAFKSKDYVDSGKYKVITIKNVQDGLIDSSSAQFVTDYPKDMRDYHKLSVGDVLLSLTGNVGRVGIVFEENLLLNQRVAKVKPKDENLLPFLYFFFRKKDFKQKLEALAKGTAQLNLSPVETLNEKIAYSDQPVLELSNRLKPFFEKIVLNNQNNKTLSSIRDSLLPKLMSGEINLNEATINE